MNYRILIPAMVAILISALAAPVFADEITGTLTGGSGSSVTGNVGGTSGGSVSGNVGGSSGGTASGTVGTGSLSGTVGSSSNSLSGTVGSGSSSSSGGGGAGSIGASAGGGGNGSVLGTSTGQQTPTGNNNGRVLGASTTNPNVPNTGAGGNAFANLLVLLTSAAGMIFGAFYLKQPRLG